MPSPSLETFVSGWYGRPGPLGLVDPTVASLPGPLREWYLLQSRYAAPLSSYHDVVAAPELHDDGGAVVIWVENQGGYEWAYREGLAGPVVVERAVGEAGERGDWLSTGLSLSEFLVCVAAFEAVVNSEHVREVAASWQLPPDVVALPPGPFAGMQLHVGEGAAVLVTAGDADGEDAATAPLVLVAGRDAESLARICGEPS